MSAPNLLSRVCIALSQVRETESIPDAINAALSEYEYGADDVTIALFDDAYGLLRVPVRRVRGRCLGPNAQHADAPGFTLIKTVMRSGTPVLIRDAGSATAEEISALAEEEGVHSYLAVPMANAEQAIGVIALGCRDPHRRYSAADLDLFSTIGLLAAGTIQNRLLVGEHLRELAKQRLALELTTAINESVDLSAILRLVRDAVVEKCGFDRAGVFLYDEANNIVHGAWGTDRHGRPEDTSWASFNLDDKQRWGLNSDDKKGYVLTRHFEELEGEELDAEMTGVQEHGSVPMRVNGTTVGFIAVDNVITQRPITEKDLEGLLPFAAQAAGAILKAQLLSASERAAAQQRRLMELAAAINSKTNLRESLRMVRDAIVDQGGFDRAAVFLYDEAHRTMRGTWGTDRQGNPEDIASQAMPLSEDDAQRLGLEGSR